MTRGKQLHLAIHFIGHFIVHITVHFTVHLLIHFIIQFTIHFNVHFTIHFPSIKWPPQAPEIYLELATIGFLRIFIRQHFTCVLR